MRAAATAASEALREGEALPRSDVLDRTRATLRGQLGAIIPQVEALTRAYPEGDAPRVSALHCTAEARARLKGGPGAGLRSATEHTRELARVLGALCRHYDYMTESLARHEAAVREALRVHTEGCELCRTYTCAVGSMLRSLCTTARAQGQEAPPCATRP